jgi:hypothetical protein
VRHVRDQWRWKNQIISKKPTNFNDIPLAQHVSGTFTHHQDQLVLQHVVFCNVKNKALWGVCVLSIWTWKVVYVRGHVRASSHCVCVAGDGLVWWVKCVRSKFCKNISAMVPEIFLQKLEHTQIKKLLETSDIIFYTRYVDDIDSLWRHTDEPQQYNTIFRYYSQQHTTKTNQWN